MEYTVQQRKKYGDDAVDKSNAKLMNMTQEEYEAMTSLEIQVRETLAQAFKTGEPACDLAQRAAELHKQLITSCWGQYSKEAHAGLAQMYVDDERFRAYYDAKQPGTAAFLRDAIRIYTGVKE